MLSYDWFGISKVDGSVCYGAGFAVSIEDAIHELEQYYYGIQIDHIEFERL